jgi:glycosyltransferase involved in cell wall biosynthesis
MTHPTLSVVIPHYNHGRYLRRAVDAIRAQSRPPLEIIIVDDASTDGSLPLLQDLAAEPTVRVHQNDRNRGVGYTSNRGLALCRGDYVYIAGADDLVLPGFFDRALSMARAYPQAGIIYGKMAKSDEAGNVVAVFEVSGWPAARFASPHDFLREHLESEDPSHSLCGATIYRRDALQALGGYRTELGHWMDTFVARAIGLRYGVCYVPEVFMKWRWSEQGFCGRSHWDEQVCVVRRAAELMRSRPFCEWFPRRHVAWWEDASLENLFRAHVRDQWPVLRRWSGTSGWPARIAGWAIKVLARLSRRRAERIGYGERETHVFRATRSASTG